MNFAGATYFNSLRYQQKLGGLELVVMDEVSPERAGGGTGGRVFHDAPGQHAAGTNAAASFQGEAISHRSVRSNELGEGTHIHLNFGQHGAAGDGDHEIGYASGNEFDRQGGHEIAGFEAESGGEGG
jgi:hypothetical protein